MIVIELQELSLFGGSPNLASSRRSCISVTGLRKPVQAVGLGAKQKIAQCLRPEIHINARSDETRKADHPSY